MRTISVDGVTYSATDIAWHLAAKKRAEVRVAELESLLETSRDNEEREYHEALTLRARVAELEARLAEAITRIGELADMALDDVIKASRPGAASPSVSMTREDWSDIANGRDEDRPSEWECECVLTGPEPTICETHRPALEKALARANCPDHRTSDATPRAKLRKDAERWVLDHEQTPYVEDIDGLEQLLIEVFSRGVLAGHRQCSDKGSRSPAHQADLEQIAKALGLATGGDLGYILGQIDTWREDREQPVDYPQVVIKDTDFAAMTPDEKTTALGALVTASKRPRWNDAIRAAAALLRTYPHGEIFAERVERQLLRPEPWLNRAEPAPGEQCSDSGKVEP